MQYVWVIVLVIVSVIMTVIVIVIMMKLVSWSEVSPPKAGVAAKCVFIIRMQYV